MVSIVKLNISQLCILLSLCVLYTRCSLLGSKQIPEVIHITDQEIISMKFPDVRLFFEKNVNDESRISITKIDLKSVEFITLPYEGNFPILSPDGKKISFIRTYYMNTRETHHIWLYDLNMKEISRIPIFPEEYKNVYLTCPSFSSDGNVIIFSVTWFDSNKNGLAKINIDGSNLDVLQTELPMNSCPEYSPDSKKIIVECVGKNSVRNLPGFQLCLLDSNGSYIKTLTTSGDGHHSYHFSPDGRYVVYSEFDIKLLPIKPTYRLLILDLETGIHNLLLNWDVSTKGFSKDGKQIIFEGRPNKKSPWGIYIINIDGSNLRHLIYFDEFLEEWYSDIEEY
jgi:Tol biopolymer transport system component